AHRTYLLEADLERLFLALPEKLPFQVIPRYPAAERDLALLIDASVPEVDISAAIREVGGALVREVRLFDVYTGEAIPAGKHSLAYRVTYQSLERTLTDDEVEAAQQRIVVALRDRFGATLRS